MVKILRITKEVNTFKRKIIFKDNIDKLNIIVLIIFTHLQVDIKKKKKLKYLKIKFQNNRVFYRIMFHNLYCVINLN
jgi:hypothetical protein